MIDGYSLLTLDYLERGLVKTLSIEKSWPPNKNYKKMTIMNLKRPWDMRLKNESIL